MRLKKIFNFCFLCFFVLSMSLFVTACKNKDEEHTHSFSMWETTTAATCISDGVQSRTCDTCGYIERATIPKNNNHTQRTIVKENNYSPTCISGGRYDNVFYCVACNKELSRETIELNKLGHNYNSGHIVSAATCISQGTKIYTCTNNNCGYSYAEAYSMPTYSATDLYNLAIEFVGEIVVYDKNGVELGLGTGFVISSDGQIVTNYHVIDGAYSAKITINEKNYSVTQILAYDENIDLAVLKINATGLSYANICKNTVQTGETVYAIGSSRGLTNTYSQGIITQANRVVDDVVHIQHDASITNGNSGGPLLNVYGEVIGINTWGLLDSQNLNFAVFTSELDNLVYGTPMTFAEFYEANLNAYETLLNWVLENYNDTGNSWISYEYQASGQRFSLYSLTYYYNTNRLCLDFYYVFSNGDARYVSIELSEDATSSEYYASYTDGDYSYQENTTQGYIYPSSFTRNTSIGYYSSEGDYWTISSLLATYQEGIVSSLAWFEVFLDACEFGFTLSDFGFTRFT